MTNYNPNNPLTLGAQWYPTAYGVEQLVGSSDAVGFLIDSSASQTIISSIVPHYWEDLTGFGKLWLEIYNLADLGEGPPETTITILPNEDKARQGITTQGGGTSGLFAAINDATPGLSDTGWIQGGSSGDFYAMQFDASIIPSSARPVAVYLDFRVYQSPPPVAPPGLNFSACLPNEFFVDWYYDNVSYGRLGTVSFVGVPVSTWGDISIGPFFMDPYNSEPWGRKAIMNLDVNTSNNIRIVASNCGLPRISRVAMRVVTVPEKRIAVAGTAIQTTPGAGLKTNLPMVFKSPLTDAANWSKTSGVDYLAVLRRLDGPLTTSPYTLKPSIPYITGSVVSPNIHGAKRTVVTSGSKGELLQVTTTNQKKTYPFVLNVGGAYSVDGNPYHSVTMKPIYST